MNGRRWMSAAICAAAVLLAILLFATGGGARGLDYALSEPTPMPTMPVFTPAPTPQPTAEPTPEPTPEPTAEPAPTPEPTAQPQPETFTLSFAGDCILSDIDGWSNFSNVVGDDYDYPFAATAEFFQNDEFSLVNLECPLSDTGVKDWTRYFAFRGKPEYVDILTRGGVDFVMTCNNHENDYGDEAKTQTRAVLDEAGVGHSGQDEAVVYTTQNGLKLGIYSAYEPQTEPVCAGVASLREQGCDLVIVSLHWGTEYHYHPDGWQVELAHAAVDAGAALVVGTHPHVLQPLEEYNGAYIFYSLGNWVFGGNTEPYDGDTALVQVEAIRAADGTVSLGRYVLYPCAMSGSLPQNDYQPVPYGSGTEEYDRALSKLLGTFDGPDIVVNRG